MASVVNDGKGWRILFVAPDGKRKTLRLGRVDKKTAESIRVDVESLLASRITGLPVQPATAAWLNATGEAFKEKLAKAVWSPDPGFGITCGHPAKATSPKRSRWPWSPSGWAIPPPLRYATTWTRRMRHTRSPCSGGPKPKRTRSVFNRTRLVSKRTLAQIPAHGWHTMRLSRFPARDGKIKNFSSQVSMNSYVLQRDVKRNLWL